MRRVIMSLSGSLALALLPTASPAQVGHSLAGGAPASAADLRQMTNNAVPAERKATSLPPEVFTFAAPAGKTKAPTVVQGSGPLAKTTAPAKMPRLENSPAVGPQNYGYNPFGGGGTNQNTIYHYTDSYVLAYTTYPNSATGHLAFVAADGGSYRCTASLISQAIAVTAGHCVHQGGDKAGRTRANGWIRSAYYVPARANTYWPYGYAPATNVYTTSGWYNQGLIQRGYDVALVVLNDRAGTTNPPGYYTGWLGYCASHCLQAYWYLTQLGYPGNYYSGLYMMQGEHLEANRNNTDFYHGSGMQGGSSGGPHVANLGYMSDSTSFKGLWPHRNYVFAVTSWGYVSDIYKIQGSSSLSGPGNTNNFPGLFAAACTRARQIHGSSTC